MEPVTASPRRTLGPGNRARRSLRRAGIQTAMSITSRLMEQEPLWGSHRSTRLGNGVWPRTCTDRPLLIGSVKTNIGHLEGASGIAGLIKLILALQHRQVPPSLNFETPNPHIDFGASKLRVVTNFEPWPEQRKLAVGGVSAFSWGGTNCHVIAEEADKSAAHLLPLSAPDTVTLNATAEKLRLTLIPARQTSPCETSASAPPPVGAEPERFALTARSVERTECSARGFLLDQKRPGVAAGRSRPSDQNWRLFFAPGLAVAWNGQESHRRRACIPGKIS